MTIASDNNNAKHQETLIKDLESEMDSLKRRHEQARNNSAAELADCREQIKHLKEINSRSISAEIEQVKIRAEKTAQFKITEMIAMAEEYKRQCDRNLAAKEKQYCYIGHKHQEALENVQTSQNNEMRAEIAKLKEELKQKEGGVDASLRPRAAPQAAVTAGTSAATPATGDGNSLAPGSAGDEAPRESSRGFRRRPRERATQTSPLPAPVTAAKLAPEGIREPLATGEMANAKRKLLYWSDSESSEGMDLTNNEMRAEIAKSKEELKQKEGGVDASSRPRAAPQAAVTAGTSAVTPAMGDGNSLAPGSAGDEAPRESSRGFRRRPRERATQTSPLPAPVTAAKSAPEGIREPLATGEMANAKRKLLYWSDSESSEGMDLTVDEQLLESASGTMPSKRSDKARAAGKNLFDAEGSGDSDDDDTDTIRASEISRKAASRRKVKRGRMISALPPSKPPAIEWGNIFDWF
ncbi:uncharacterized protein LOC142920807 isoform X1 [Petromyzon marinus]|uniref:uncharacterized protein LOC142920807 isoform X1 n=2 Tax=Petromyzon marinus TaxID=7757 RepID=UPI003F7292A3